MEESKKRSFSHFTRTPSKRYARVTIPIGRPSWSTSNNDSEKTTSTATTNTNDTGNNKDNNDNNNTNDDVNDNNNPHKKGGNSSSQSSSTSTSNDTKNNVTPRSLKASGSAAGVSQDDPVSFRPKSLTLKSFMYIDESKPTISTNDQNQQNDNISSMVDGISDGPSSGTTFKRENNIPSNGVNRDLKRCDSLRISSSIRGALSLTKKASVSGGSQLARSLRDRFLAGKSRSAPKSTDKMSSSTSSSSNNMHEQVVTKSNSNHSTLINSSIHEEQEVDQEDQEQQGHFDHDQVSSSDQIDACQRNGDSDDADFETSSERGTKIVHLLPGKDGRYGFKIRKVPSNMTITSRRPTSNNKNSNNNNNKPKRVVIIYELYANSPAANSEPRLYEGDKIISINGISVDNMSLSKVGKMIKSIRQKFTDLALEVSSRFSIDSDVDSLEDGDHVSNNPQVDCNTNSISCQVIANNQSNKSLSCDFGMDETKTLADSILDIKQGLANRKLIEDFERLFRKKEDESLEESRLMENMDKNRYQDILPYDSTRVQLLDSMTGDYINASFVNMLVPNGIINRYIATQGPLASTCDDFWQMVWEQNSSLIIMVTPLIEGGRTKCHKYWPDERDGVRHGQILVKNLHEKCRAATIDRKLQLTDVKVSLKTYHHINEHYQHI